MIDISDSTLLFVDDDSQCVQVFEHMFSETDYEIVVATNSKKALELAKIVDVDVVLLDVGLPGMDGYELCSQLKQQKKFEDVPFIFMTGHSDFDNVTKGFALGAFDYLGKPMHLEKARASIQNALMQRHLLKEVRRLNEKV